MTPLEAMVREIPVVASDFDGYRDTVVNGETGFLVPTRMAKGACGDITARLLCGGISYDEFLAEVGQTVTVSIPDTADALLRLAQDESLRERMGARGVAGWNRGFAGNGSSKTMSEFGNHSHASF